MYSVTEQLVSWLAALGYRASTRVPKDAPSNPEEFVTVERTGGGVSNMVDRPLVAVQAWAPTEERAERMATAIRNAALTMLPPKGVHSLRVNAGPYPFYDELTRCPRYQLVLDVACQLTDNEQTLGDD